MNLSLHRLRKKLKSGQGSLVAVGLSGLALSTLIASATVWYLSMHKNINKSSDELSAVSAAYNEWNKIVHDDFVQSASKSGKSESVDVMGKFTVITEYGSVGIPNNNGTCRKASEAELDDVDEMCMPIALTVKDKDGNVLHASEPTLFSSNAGVSSIPDYSQGIVVDKSKPWIAPADGMIFLWIQNGCAYPTAYANQGMTIDGVIVARHTLGVHIEDGYMETFPVKKGMEIKTFANNSDYNSLMHPVFYPYMGKKVKGSYTKPPTETVVDNSSQQNNKVISDPVPVGTILPYYGSLLTIPEGWHLCDGTNGTPDLRDRFLTGAGSSYALGATGGENFHTLTIDEMPSHNHPFSNSGSLSAIERKRARDYITFGYDEYRYSNGYLPTSFSSLSSGYAGGSQAHENRPPFYAVYYIMKIK